MQFQKFVIKEINNFIFNKKMAQNIEIGDELPCGGYVQEDKIIQKNMKILSQQQYKGQKQYEGQVNKQQKNIQAPQLCCKDQGIKYQSNQEKPQIAQKQCKSCQCQQTKNKKIEEAKIQQARKITKKICKKCKTQPSALIHKNEPICKQCLLKNIEYKCRLTLQNSMRVTQKSNILICFSGGLNSICLVNIFSNLKKRYQKHHLFGELRCVHIQQQSTISQDYKTKFEMETGIPLEIIQIGQVFEGQNKGLSDVKEIFSMFNNSANTADLLTLFRDRLICDYAKKHNFNFIVKGLNGQSIAGSIFKFFVKGIGSNVTQLSSSQQDSLFHYPLRQHLQKQLQYYFYTLNCSKLSLISHDDDLSNVCSNYLDNHLNDFILNLQTMYSHTAPAITRTAQKIQSNRQNQIRCKWCFLKGSFQPHQLCRKCQRMYESKNKSFNNEKIPFWLRVQK